MPLRIIFMGTPDFAVPVLVGLVGAGHEIMAVYTQPPRAAGRGLERTPSPVHRQAEAFSLPVFTPTSLKEPDEQRRFAELGADLAVVVAYGLILPRSILQATRLGAYNLHASLLPRWRGAAPIQRAIMAGDSESGVMVMKMDEGLDTGPVAMAERMTIKPDMTSGELHDALSKLGADLMVRAIGALERETLDLSPQSEDGVTYAAKIDKSEARIDWTQPAAQIHNQIRGLSPFPGAWFEMGGRKERVKVLAASIGDGQGQPGELLDRAFTVACGCGAVKLTRLQRAGRAAVSADEFARGMRLAPGTVLA